MMHGKLNTNKLCRIMEQILNERDENIKYKVNIIDEDNDSTKDSIVEINNNEFKK